MTIPKKRQPLADKTKISQALEAAGRENNIPKETVDRAANKHSKKIGRPALKDNRTARITFYLSQETFNRFNLAFPQEQYKQVQQASKTDKSLILERLLEEWLKNNGY